MAERTVSKQAAEAETVELGVTIGTNLRRLRTKQGLSLEALARQASVSRAMIGQIEAGRSMPTIGLLFKITRALGVPFAALMGGDVSSGMNVLRADRAKVLTSQDGNFISRALFPFDGERRVEFYELTMKPHAFEQASPHAAGTSENLTVAQGEIEITTAAESAILKPGDSIFFQADTPHSYRNLSPGVSIMYLVMNYAQNVG
jgi:transcriptional regulator with XRE-family HTH domain